MYTLQIERERDREREKGCPRSTPRRRLPALRIRPECHSWKRSRCAYSLCAYITCIRQMHTCIHRLHALAHIPVGTCAIMIE